MKSLFLMLLFANIVLYFWVNMPRTDIGESALNAPLYEPVSIEILHVVSNDKHDVAAFNSKEVVQAKKNESNLCLEIGSFGSDEAASLSQQLAGLSQHLLIVSNDQLAVKKFWVVSPAAKTWEESVTNADDIKSKGVRDMWLVPNGSDRGVVSLGLFVNKDKAIQRMEEMLSKAIDVEMIEILKERKSIRLENIFSPRDIFRQINKLFTKEDLSIQKINC